jgi:hypothetical protein
MLKTKLTTNEKQIFLLIKEKGTSFSNLVSQTTIGVELVNVLFSLERKGMIKRDIVKGKLYFYSNEII